MEDLFNPKYFTKKDKFILFSVAAIFDLVLILIVLVSVLSIARALG